MSTTRTTCHFVNKAAADIYYRKHGDYTPKEVDRKIRDREIEIGPPELREGERYTVKEGQYLVHEKE